MLIKGETMKKLLLTFGVITLTALTSNAHIETNHTTTEQYMLNSGYSAEVAKWAKLTSRDPYAPTDDIYPKYSAKRFFKYLWKKVDPTAFPDDNFEWHSIQYSPSLNDL